jgi:hypothetical protein
MNEFLKIGLAFSESLALLLVVCGIAWGVMFYLYLWKWDFLREVLGLKERPQYIPSARMAKEEEERKKEQKSKLANVNKMKLMLAT